MDIPNKRKGNPDENRSRKKVTKRPPPIRPSNTASLDDVSFKRTSVGVSDHYRLETWIKPGYHLAFMKKYPHTAAFVRQSRVPSEQIVHLKPVIHRNIVNLRRVYIEGDSVSMVYEMTIASLKDILNFRPNWGVAETAAVCYSVLSALKYIHGVLGISHGGLGIESLRFDSNGLVKIDNIGECLIGGSQRYADDIHALGSIVRRIAEPNELRVPSLADFLQGLESGQPASTLLQHEFLKNSNGPEQLQHCVDVWLATRLFFP